MIITPDDIITTQGKHKDRAREATEEIKKNAEELADKLSRISVSYGHDFDLTSGYRTKSANTAAGGAPNSHHLFGRAADINDPSGDLALWCLTETQLLMHFGLWMEDPRWTRKRHEGSLVWTTRWVHLQTRAPPSGMTVFRLPGPQPK